MAEMVKKPVKITETILRDAHQSLIATRMTTEQMMPIVEKMDKVGYHAVECWGGATFDAEGHAHHVLAGARRLCRGQSGGGDGLPLPKPCRRAVRCTLAGAGRLYLQRDARPEHCHPFARAGGRARRRLRL